MKTPAKKHRAYVRESGRSSYRGHCQCRWVGPQRTMHLMAWIDCRQHDPDFPQIDKLKRAPRGAA